MNNAEFPNRGMGCGIAEIVGRIALAATAALGLVSCQSADKPSFPPNPTDSGSRYSEFNLPGSNMGMQNTDLED